MFFKKKKRRKKSQRRYVYLMERVTNREWSSILEGKREIKIGIAKNTRLRNRSVDLGIPGKVIILDQYKVDQASKVEAHIHRIYKDYNFKVKGAKRGAGGTEFYKLSNRDIRQVKRILSRTQRSASPPIIQIIVFSVLLVYLIHYFT